MKGQELIHLCGEEPENGATKAGKGLQKALKREVEDRTEVSRASIVARSAKLFVIYASRSTLFEWILCLSDLVKPKSNTDGSAVLVLTLGAVVPFLYHQDGLQMGSSCICGYDSMVVRYTSYSSSVWVK